MTRNMWIAFGIAGLLLVGYKATSGPQSYEECMLDTWKKQNMKAMGAAYVIMDDRISTICRSKFPL
jgi:hypothetical protein